MRKIVLGLVLGVIVMGSSGCFMLIAGAAAGAGTAYWLSEKLSQQFEAPYDRVVSAAERALQEMKMPILKQSKSPEVTQFRSTYAGGQAVWIDVRRITQDSTKVEVRVGTVEGDKGASEQILKKIRRHVG